MTICDPLITYIDLRHTPCPLNLIRCRLVAEKLDLDQSLKVDIDIGEPEETVVFGLRDSGFEVKIIKKEKEFLTLLISHIGS
tara:strand:- start:6981 stop:7226 length:246 start_codon:yes stop_codon:yes gene_type:complete